jgi:hypothetical protein
MGAIDPGDAHSRLHQISDPGGVVSRLRRQGDHDHPRAAPGGGAEKGLAVALAQLLSPAMAGPLQHGAGLGGCSLQLFKDLDHGPQGRGEMAIAPFQRIQAPLPQGGDQTGVVALVKGDEMEQIAGALPIGRGDGGQGVRLPLFQGHEPLPQPPQVVQKRHGPGPE